jgi:SAM-dependent methyltransferase
MLKPLRAWYEAQLPFARALDLGCGTGLSSMALTELARSVVAVDVSRTMLYEASTHPNVSYLAARAEELPLSSGAFDLATLGCAFHWCEPDEVFAELRRVLSEEALLVIYDNGFFGEMRENEEASPWLRSDYTQRYPAPPRRSPFRRERTPRGFTTEHEEFVEAWIPLSCAGLVRYLTTQSNIIDAVESGRATLAEIEQDLEKTLVPFFRAARCATAHFRFGGRVSALRHHGGPPGTA